MKLKDIKTNKGQQELFQALIKWNVEQNDFITLSDLLNSSETVSFIKDYIEDVTDEIYKEELATKLQNFFIAKAENTLLINNFRQAIYEKDTDPEAFSRSLPELNTTDKNQPDAINKLMCARFSSEIKPTDIFFFPCAGRGSDALYVCNTYNVPKDNCFFIENNFRLCLRLINLGFNNVICRDILSTTAWTELYNMLKEKNMIINKVLMNPPYDGSLHLKVLDTVLTNVRGLNPEAELVTIQPARWLEDPLAEYKQNSDYKKYKTIIDQLSNLQLVSTYDASDYFKITTSQDLAIYTFKKGPVASVELFTPIANACLTKILSQIKVSLRDKTDQKAHDGWRCEIKEMLPVSVGSHGSEGEWSKSNNVCVVKHTGKVVFYDGLDETGNPWYTTRAANGHADIDFLYSIKFSTKEVAENFAESCRARFYKNLVYLVKFDQHAPLRFLPYMEDYSKVWTDEDYCEFFGLNEEETEFMCRTVDDYRVKDFINYISLED